MNPSPLWFEPTIHRDVDTDLLHMCEIWESFAPEDVRYLELHGSGGGNTAFNKPAKKR
jgi:hypothetical protein